MSRTARLRVAGAALLTVAATSTHAQHISVDADASVAISADIPENPFSESFLAVNPTDPLNLIATSTAISEHTLRAPLYVTHDGGRTWERVRLGPRGTSLEDGGDPIVYFNANGTAYYSTIFTQGYRIARSTDGGRTWSEPFTVPGGVYDRQWIAFDDSDGQYRGRMYTSGTIRSLGDGGDTIIANCYSDDDGRTWSAARLVVPHKDLAVFAVGQIFVMGNSRFVVPYSAATPNLETGEMVWSLHVIWSDDGGISYSQPVKLAESVPPTDRMMSVISVLGSAVDKSDRATAGRAYMSYPFFDGERFRPAVFHSDDGATWSEPVFANDDDTRGDHGNPAIAVNNNGVVAMIWNDRRHDPSDTCWRVYAAASTDGGETFGPNVALTQTPTCPNAEGNWLPGVAGFRSSYSGQPKHHFQMVTLPSRFQNGGETQGLVAASDGAFHAAFIHDPGVDVMQLWGGRFTVDGTAPAGAAAEESHPVEHDLNTLLNVEYDRAELDFERGTLEIRMRLTNTSDVNVGGPVELLLETQQSGLEGLTVTGAANDEAGPGAVWAYSFVRSAGMLAPGASTPWRKLRWTFTKGQTIAPQYPADLRFSIRRPADRDDD